MNIHKYNEALKKICGKTIAVIYIFEGDEARGYKHYHVWRSSELNGWLSAIYEIGCIPYITDLRNFVERTMNKTLPKIDYVLNLNCGAINLSTLGVIPSVSSYAGLPVIPCNTVSIMAGENKYISNMIALSVGLQVPKEVNEEFKDVINRPISYGSSIDVKRNYDTNGLNQEFIYGLDITIPFVYHPLRKEILPFPSIIYKPNSNSSNWYFGESEKSTQQGYRRQFTNLIDESLISLYKKMMYIMSIKTYCRIDARIKCSDIETEFNRIENVNNDNTFFIEINPMPTINIDNSFGASFSNISESSSFYNCIKTYESIFGNCSVHGFLLTSSILAEGGK